MIEIKNQIENLGYCTVNIKSPELNIEELKRDTSLTLFNSDPQNLVIISKNNYLEIKPTKNEVSVLKNAHPSLLKKYSTLKENILDVILSLDIILNFLDEKDFIFFDFVFDFNSFEFDLLKRKHNISFFINNNSILKDKIIETQDSIFIMHNHQDKLSTLYYKYAYLSKITKRIRVISFELIDFNVILRMYKFEDDEFLFLQGIQYKLNIFRLPRAEYYENFKNIEVVNSLEIFPQADNFNLIWSLYDALKEQEYTREDLVILINQISGGVVDRQISYYLTAMLYLDILIMPKNGIYKLSSFSKMKKMDTLQNQVKYLCDSILRHRVFNETFKYYIDSNELPSKEMIAKIIYNTYTINYKESTLLRRATTVRAWLSWIISNLY